MYIDEADRLVRGNDIAKHDLTHVRPLLELEKRILDLLSQFEREVRNHLLAVELLAMVEGRD